MNDGTNDYYYSHDHLFSPTALMAANGSVLERYEYDAYGRATVIDYGTDQTYFTADDVLFKESSYGNPYLFTGRRLDALNHDEEGNSQLEIMYYRSRYYDTNIGRFLTHDMLGVVAEQKYGLFPHRQYIDGLNIYAYAKYNPGIYSDPYGQIGVIPAVIIAAAACYAPHVAWWHLFAEQNNDKYAHCVVSCRISKSCSKFAAILAGYGKELRDEIAQRLGKDDIGWDPADNAANKAGRRCSGWESWLPVCGMVGRLFRKSCKECCADKGYVNEKE